MRAPTFILCLAIAPAVHATGLDAAVSVGSDFVVRGETRTLSEPVVQAHLGWSTRSGWSVGALASTININPGPGPARELDLVIARTWQPSVDWTLRGGIARYIFSETAALSYDYSELTAAVAFRDRLEVSLAYMPDYSDFSFRGITRDETALSYDVQTRFPLSSAFQLTAGAGYFDLDRLFGTGYLYWSAAAEVSIDRMTLALQYIGADHTARALFGRAAVEDRLVATLAVRLH